MVARIIEFCAKNRFLVLLGVAFALFASAYSIRHAKLDAIPDLSDPQVIVFTDWMGRSPTLVEDQVTYPIVSSLIAAPHVTDVRGFSMFGMSFVYVVFEEGTDVYWARSRVLEYLSTIRERLPEGARSSIGPDATGIGWVFQYALVDKTGKHGLDELRTFQDFTLRYALGSVAGVAEVASVGGYQKQYQVTVDPEKLRAYGVTLNEVTAAIRDSNDDVGGRVLEMSGREYFVRGRGYIQSLSDIEKTAVRNRGPGGVPILVRDLGSVRFGPDIRRGLLEWNGEGEAVGAIVTMRYGENALDVIERVKRKLDELRPTFPEGVEVEIAYDRSALIGRSIRTLRHALIEEAVVVSLVIVLFLLHLRSALLPILSLPLSVAIAFIPMYLLDIPSTIMSLGGIAIAMNEQLQLPGWTKAWTMPIKTRVDMLTTGIRTPIGVKVFGTDLNAIEEVGTDLERLLSAIPGTRSVLYERNLGGLYLDIVPNRDALARYGLRVGDVERTIEAAIGGAPVTVTIEGRKRFSVNVRYPGDARADIERLREILVPVGGAGPDGSGMTMPGTTGALTPGLGLNSERAGCSPRPCPRWAAARVRPSASASRDSRR